MKKQKAITLVALIITVIILLILATVSINLVMNGNLIGKAKTAVDKYTDEEVGEQVKLSYLEYQTEKLYRSNLDLKEFMENSLGKIYEEVTITPYSETEIMPMLITIGQREFLLKKDGIPSAKKGITEYDVSKHPETYYGHYVTNYNSPNDAGIQVEEGQLGKWQIFMADDTNIYLIASNLITRKYTGTKNGVGFDYDMENYTPETATAMRFRSIKDQYNANFTTTDIPNILSRLDKQNIYHKWMNNIDNQTRNYVNERAVASMLDVDLWSGYINSTYAKYAIGGPTVEMFCKSYNETRTEDTALLEAKDTNVNYDNGYTVEKGGVVPPYGLSNLNRGVKGDSEWVNDMFFKGDYWIASPAAGSGGELFHVYPNGNMQAHDSGWYYKAFRPLVCLNSNVQLKLNEDGQTYSLEVN